MELQTTIKASSAHFEWSVLFASFIQSYKDGHYSSLLTTWKCVPLVDLLNSLLWAVVCHLHFATWDTVTTCTSDFFPRGMWLCSIDKATKGLGMRLAACKNKPLSENDNSLWKMTGLYVTESPRITAIEQNALISGQDQPTARTKLSTAFSCLQQAVYLPSHRIE